MGAIQGLSPHGRGKLTRWSMRAGLGRSIPARAGETASCQTPPPPSQVYPRTGGGNVGGGTHLLWQRGLSPHGRGKRHDAGAADGGRRSIPARAGETRGPRRGRWDGRVYPRTGGGNSDISGVFLPVLGLSPHGRGKHCLVTRPGLAGGSIPARAGETTPGNSG